MQKDQLFEIIENKYGVLSRELKTDWAKRSLLLELKKCTVLVKRGAYSKKVWFVAEGSTRAKYIKQDKAICDWFTLSPEFICAITSYYTNQPSMHQIDLLSDAILLETTHEDLQYLCDKYHDFERLARLSTTETMLRLQQRIIAIQFETAADRLSNLLKKHPNIYQQMALGDIASYIGITQETLSRIRSNAACSG